MLTLGIETSCDETAASIIRDEKEVLSNIVLSSIKLHSEFGGVIPEIAHRFHLKFIDRVTKEALKKAKVFLKEVDLIAATRGPGLIGALLVGFSFAKSISFARGLPFIGVNHLHAHLYSAMMSNTIKFPFVGLIISGGHTALVLVKGYNKYFLLGQTLDDAAGEAFDKAANVLGLEYPGGPIIDKLTREKDVKKVEFPRSFLGKDSLDFSFSGLKTAVLYYVRDHYKRDKIPENDKISIASGFQESVVDVLVHKSILALKQTGTSRLVAGGGVSRNWRLRERLSEEAVRVKAEVYFPDLDLCLDNAAMIAGLGYQLYRKGYKDKLNITPKANLSV
jgi:N6-L-threonylcarbamoyladenine synthase